MDLKGTQTEKNLILAYTGESLNRNLYTYFAYQAKKEGYEQIAAIFLETADHEHEHARQELNFIQTSDIELPAGIYPVKGVGNTISNLETAVAGEHYEQSTMYPEFAKTADKEGFSEIAQMLRHIGTVEARHEKRYFALLNNVKEDKEPPHICPICVYDRAYFELFAENY